MKLAVASGKGGAGKTFLAVSMAWCAPAATSLLDCDVEAPNAALFVRPEQLRTEPVTVPVPELDASRCTACGSCGKICQFHAIATLGRPPLLFPELCHGCGGCMLVCPTGALRETERAVGVVELGERAGRTLVTGRLNVGEAQAPPVIRAVKRHAPAHGHAIIDCPPGAACPLVAALSGCDYVLLVAEPTPFGAHDLAIAAEAVRLLGLPVGVVINRARAHDQLVRRVCEQRRLPVLAEIAQDRTIARACAEGRVAVETMPALRALVEQLWQDVLARAADRPPAAPKGWSHADL